MKRQLGTVIAVLALFCVPLAWAQSDSTDSSSSSSSSSSGSSSSSASSSSGASVPDATGADATGVDAAGGSDANGASAVTVPGITAAGFTDPSFQTGQAGQAGSGDSGQSDAGDNLQTGPDNSQTANGPQATFNHPEQLPPLALINDVTKNTGLAFTMNVGTLNDYVKGGHGQSSYWENMLMTNAGIAFSQLRERSLVQLGYTGGVSLTALTYGGSNTYTTLNQTGHALILWNFASHWQMRIKENYLYTDDPFAPFLEYVGSPTPNQPNPTVFFPNSIVEQNRATMDLSYRLSANDSLNFQGSESFQRFVRGAGGLWNSYTWGGSGFYQHNFSHALAAGGGYNYNALDFGHGQSRAGVQAIEGFIMYRFNSGLMVSGWFGPERTATKDLITLTCIPPFGCLIEEKHRTEWNTAEGGTMSYLHNGNSVRFQFSHSVTDGGGVLGAVNQYTATLAYARPLNRLWGFSSAAMYSNNRSVSHVIDQYWNATQGMINFTRKIGESWNGSVYLLLIHQNQNFYGLTPGASSAAGVGLTLHYVWGHSLGQ